ncbi:MAG: hypothetical protein ACPGUX_00845 [Halocynthiibacter sp.]
MKGYLRRKTDRGWFFGTFSFAHQYPEVFRIAFENTLRNTPGQLDFLDLLGQYYFAAQAENREQPVLVDEGLLHRGAAAFLNPEAFSDLEYYLDHIPPCDVVVFSDLDIETSIERSRQRPKGLPQLYRRFTEEELITKYQRLQILHQTCLAHQAKAGARIIHLNNHSSLAENTTHLYEALVKPCQSSGTGLR